VGGDRDRRPRRARLALAALTLEPRPTPYTEDGDAMSDYFEGFFWGVLATLAVITLITALTGRDE
jgi:hypothetical protein